MSARMLVQLASDTLLGKAMYGKHLTLAKQKWLFDLISEQLKQLQPNEVVGSTICTRIKDDCIAAVAPIFQQKTSVRSHTLRLQYRGITCSLETKGLQTEALTHIYFWARSTAVIAGDQIALLLEQYFGDAITNEYEEDKPGRRIDKAILPMNFLGA